MMKKILALIIIATVAVAFSTYQLVHHDGTMTGDGTYDNPLTMDTTDRPDGVATQYMINALKAVIYSGIYSPTVATYANLDEAPSFSSARYMRIGDVVTVSGEYTANPNTISTTTYIRIDPPAFDAQFDDDSDASGTAYSQANGDPAQIQARSGSNAITIQWTAGADSSTHTWSYQYTYLIIH